MALPYQCIVAGNNLAEGNHEWVLFGASSSRLAVQSSKGATSVWPTQESHARNEALEETQEPPGKKIKLSPSTEQKSNFSNLVLSNDQQHVVAVTAEDKCIRVFHVDSKLQLQQLSQRCMARRPCSITLTSDDSTILCADKFGDVYALPLLVSPEVETTEAPISEQVEQKSFVPSASLLTVHSGRNRKTLEEQLKQASKGQVKYKEPLKFKHELLLGHVSMLTDIAYTTIDSRSYILTADRDEHIRISRGPPQAHIIEGFCQGHEEFINKLCLTRSGHLVSGGGDAHLYVWDWLNCRLLERLAVRDAVWNYLRTQPEYAQALSQAKTDFKTAVSGIWSVPCSRSESEEILVACEGVPALFGFKIGSSPVPEDVLPLNGNALDVAFINLSQTSCTAVVSIDNVHKPGSTTEMREDEGTSRLQYFSYQQDGQWREDRAIGTSLDWLSRWVPADETRNASSRDARSEGKASNGAGLGADDEKAVRDMLYGVENLRKRPGAED